MLLQVRVLVGNKLWRSSASVWSRLRPCLCVLVCLAGSSVSRQLAMMERGCVVSVQICRDGGTESERDRGPGTDGSWGGPLGGPLAGARPSRSSRAGGPGEREPQTRPQGFLSRAACRPPPIRGNCPAKAQRAGSMQCPVLSLTAGRQHCVDGRKWTLSGTRNPTCVDFGILTSIMNFLSNSSKQTPIHFPPFSSAPQLKPPVDPEPLVTGPPSAPQPFNRKESPKQQAIASC